MTGWHYTYTGRGYLRFPELTVDAPSSAGVESVRVRRGGPSRVDLVISGEHANPGQPACDEIAQRLHGLVVVFCQAPILDFHLNSSLTTDDDGTPRHLGYMHALGVPVRDAAVTVPFQHMTDMDANAVAELTTFLREAKPVPPQRLDLLQHLLTESEGSVESFMSYYGLLESLVGKKQHAVDTFIRGVEPGVELVKNSRGMEVTIYTQLRNAKGHPSGMAPAESSAKIRSLLPRLKDHVRTALIESSTP